MKSIYFKEVEFAHLRVKVKFCDLSKLKGVPIQGSGYTTLLSHDELANLEVGVFIQDIETSVKSLECMPTLFHEITHAVQYICEQRGIDMELEKESVAYMVHYLGETVMGLRDKAKAPSNTNI